MSSYTYDISSTFPSGYNSTKLYKDIRQFIAKPSTFSFTGDTFYLSFSITLSSGQQSALTTIINEHTATTDPVGDTVLAYRLASTTFGSTSYQSCGSFEFPGRNIDTLTNIHVLASANSGNYSIRVFDITNSNTIAEATFTNTVDALNDLGTISNEPYGPAIIDVQIKVSSVLVTANPKSIMFYYYNVAQ